MLFQVNFLAILVVALLNLVLGFVWFSPQMVGSLFYTNKEKNMCEAQVKKPWKFASCVFEGFLFAWALAIFLYAVDPPSVTHAIGVGLTAWIGFTFTFHLSAFVWEKETASQSLMNALYTLIYVIIASVILYYWI